MIPPLRWAICGTGRVCSDFIQALKLLPDKHQIVAVGATSAERAINCVHKHKLQAEAVSSHAQAYCHPQADAVYIGVVNSAHLPLTLAALSNGKHVLCEKPLALNANQVQQVTEASKTSSKMLLENAWTLFFPTYQQMKDDLTQGKLGDVHIISAQCGFVDRESAKHDPSLGGGFLLGPGYYLPLIAMDLMGWTMPTKITAAGILEKSGVDRTASVSMVFPTGTVAHLLYTGTSQIKAWAQITGTYGQISINNNLWCPTEYSLKAEIFKDQLPLHSPTNFNYPNSAGFTYIQEHFRVCIEKGLTESPIFTLHKSHKLAQILDEIRKNLGVKYPQDT